MQLLPFWYLLPLMSLHVNLITFMRFLHYYTGKLYQLLYYTLNANGMSKSFNKPAIIFETRLHIWTHHAKQYFI